ncbi:MAG: Mur ligase family protein [Chlamydiia bacterium]
MSGKAAFRLFLTKGIVPLTYDDTYPGPVDLSQVDRIILSPGFTLNHTIVVAAQERGIPIQSEIDFALEHIRGKFVIGITGSNGKSTMVKQIEHVLNYYGIRAEALGNVEVPLSSAIVDPPDVFVIELSAQQLETTHQKVLDLGVILNVQPNHLDRYQTMENYKQAKLRIFDLVKEGGEKLGPEVSSELVFEKIGEKFFLKKGEITSALASYKNLPHRLEYLGDFFGKKIYNDSKSTTFSSTLYALKKVAGPIQLIFGGRSKGEDLGAFVEELKTIPLKRVLAIGETMEEIRQALEPSVEVILCTTLEKAVQEGIKGEGNLLLSPGFASYDQFHSYAHRGDTFKQRIEWEKKMLS